VGAQGNAPASAPSQSQVYTWEPSNAAIAARYGLRPEQILRFDTNTVPLPPPMLPGALGGPFEPSVNEYPDSSYQEVSEAAAAYYGVEPHELVIGAGADEVLDLIAKTYLPLGAAAMVPIPTYAMYGVLTGQRAARITAVPRLGPADGFALDVNAMVARLPEVRLVWLCSPNNPTGAADSPADLEAVISAAADQKDPVAVAVDEAYFEFGGQTLIGLRSRYNNLVVVRTTSKAFALAGARVGFGVADRSVIERLERVRPPGSVSTISGHVATLAFRSPQYALDNVATLSAERQWLASGLATRGWTPAPSTTNFLLAKIGDHDAAERAADGLLHTGIVPRTFGPANPLRGHLRLTVRSRAENERLLEVVDHLA
jgi:histidinol-phosphate aminotransferase